MPDCVWTRGGYRGRGREPRGVTESARRAPKVRHSVGRVSGDFARGGECRRFAARVCCRVDPGLTPRAWDGRPFGPWEERDRELTRGGAISEHLGAMAECRRSGECFHVSDGPADESAGNGRAPSGRGGSLRRCATTNSVAAVTGLCTKRVGRNAGLQPISMLRAACSNVGKSTPHIARTNSVG